MPIQKTTNELLYIISAVLLLAYSILIAFAAPVSAAQITSRSLTLGSSAASTVTTYQFSFTVPTTGTIVKSIAADICTTASGTCTKPTGFANNSSTLPSQPTGLGDATGWTVNTSTDGSLRASKTGNATTPSGSQSITWGNVTNPSATNSTFFARITTYSDASWTTAVDTGTVASSTAGQVTVSASVGETLSFTLAAQSVDLGTLTASSTGSGTSTMSAATNAGSGYSITVNGSTLTAGLNTITALAAKTASSQGSEQFGLNLKDNATPNVGSEVSGSGSGAASTNYNTADQYRFVSGDTVASAAAATNTNTYTVSYIANVTASTEPGSYSTVLTYIATANF